MMTMTVVCVIDLKITKKNYVGYIQNQINLIFQYDEDSKIVPI